MPSDDWWKIAGPSNQPTSRPGPKAVAGNAQALPTGDGALLVRIGMRRKAALARALKSPRTHMGDVVLCDVHSHVED